MTVESGGHKSPVLKMFAGARRQEIIQFMLEQPAGEQFSKTDVVRKTGASSESVRQNLTLFTQFGLLDKPNPDVPHPRYECSDTPAMEILQSWHDEDGYPLVKLFKSRGPRDLTKFVLNSADVNESYSMSEVHQKSGIHESTVSDNIDVLVDAGLLDTVSGKIATEYTKNPDSELVEYLPLLNDKLKQAYHERSE